MIILALCVFLFFLAFLLVHLLVPVAQRMSVAFDLFDRPSERKIHKEPISRFGGVAILGSLLICLFFVRAFYDAFSFTHGPYRFFWRVLCGGAVLVFLLGIIDDIFGLNAVKKLSVQILIGAVVFILGFRIDGLFSPFTSQILQFGSLSPVLTIFWVVACMNAINLIDGVDGLVSGLAAICFGGLSAISCLFGYNECALVSVVLAGAAAGFLCFNFNPAKIFLGDCGSLLLGFLLSFLPLIILDSAQVEVAATGNGLVLYPGVLMILFIPFLDMCLAILRRGLRYVITSKNASVRHGSSKITYLLDLVSSVFQPDMNHIHHELMRSGCGQKKTVLILYCIQCAFLVIGMGVFFSRGIVSLVFLLLFGFVSYLLLRAINLREVSDFIDDLKAGLIGSSVVEGDHQANSVELNE